MPMRQLMLPKLVAESNYKASVGHDSPISADAPSMASSSSSSIAMSEPVTPTFSLRAHTRNGSQNSSLASSPSELTQLDNGAVNSKTKLTKLAEDPMELEDDVAVANDERRESGCECAFIRTVTCLSLQIR